MLFGAFAGIPDSYLARSGQVGCLSGPGASRGQFQRNRTLRADYQAGQQTGPYRISAVCSDRQTLQPVLAAVLLAYPAPSRWRQG